MPEAIDPSKIPGEQIDPDTIEAQAGVIRSNAGLIRDHGSDVHRKWQGMSAVYSAPESGTLLGLMQPVSSQATQAGDNLETVASALSAFATEVRPIKQELDSLRAQAESFRALIAGGVTVRELNPAWVSTQGYYGTGGGGGAYSGSWNAYGAASGSSSSADVSQYRYVTKEWHEVQEHVDRNNELIAAVNAAQVRLWDAERTCANKIRALYGADALRAFQSENDALGYGLEEIPEGTEMPWGSPVERSESCGEAATSFVFKDLLWEGIVVGGIWGTVEGLGTLVLGYNPETGDWFSGDAYGAAWGNLGMLAASLAIAATPPLNIMYAADDVAQQFGGGFLPDEVRDFKDKADETLLNTGKALIAWDQWADDPGTALGETVFNVGTILIPAGAAITGVKTAGTAANVLSKMAKVVDFVDPGAWAFNGVTRVGSFGVGSLDNLIGRMDDAVTSFETPNVEVYTAMDSASGLRALDDWGVDMNAVTARVDDGIPVLEAPGIRVELPQGAFDNAAGGGVRLGGDADAGVTAPVREPELVAAGVRGETGPGAVNSIVDDAPVRTETGGSGESTAVREADTATGGGASGDAGDGSGDAGGSGDTGGSGGSGGSGADDLGGGAGDAGDAADGAAGGGSGGDGAGSGPAGGEGAGGVSAVAAAGHPSDPIAWRSTENPDLVLTESQKAAVEDVHARAELAEPRITGALQDIAERHPDVRMEGLENSVKSEDSFARKVATHLHDAVIREGMLTPRAVDDALFASSRDTVRYTYIVDEGSYATNVHRLVDELQADGFRLSEFKNSWGGAGYQGINSVWIDPSGQKFEVQFHTDASYVAKTEAHSYYESDRAGNAAPEVAEANAAAQQEIFGRVPEPGGAAEIGIGEDFVDVLDGTGDPTGRLVADADVAETIAQSFHNYDASEVMLGKYDGGGPTSYISQAGDDYTYFDLGASWGDIQRSQGLSNDDMFTLYNASFLDDAIVKGKTVQFSHSPVGDPGYLGMELRYLQSHGYVFDPRSNVAYPPTD